MKITVVTPTFRETDRLLACRDCLVVQTFQLYEWVIVDDYAKNRSFSCLGIPIIHVLPRVVTSHWAWPSACNTGVMYARGELIYLMCDYMRPDPDVLARHWEIYEKHGPNVIISGQHHAGPGWTQGTELRQGDRYVDEDVQEVVNPVWLDRWFAAGRNDSVPLEALLAVNGWNETFDGRRGQQEFDLAHRLVRSGCRYLTDTRTYATLTEHGAWKPEMPKTQEWVRNHQNARQSTSLWAPNPFNLREERQRVMELRYADVCA